MKIVLWLAKLIVLGFWVGAVYFTFIHPLPGKISTLIPAFAVGRSQGLMYALYRLRQAGAIPDMPIVLDSPMAISATEVYDRHHEEHRLSADEVQDLSAWLQRLNP